MEIPMQSDFLLEILQMKSDLKDCLLMIAGVLLTATAGTLGSFVK